MVKNFYEINSAEEYANCYANPIWAAAHNGRAGMLLELLWNWEQKDTISLSDIQTAMIEAVRRDGETVEDDGSDIDIDNDCVISVFLCYIRTLIKAEKVIAEDGKIYSLDRLDCLDLRMVQKEIESIDAAFYDYQIEEIEQTLQYTGEGYELQMKLLPVINHETADVIAR